jgi:hypothetical protein
MACCTWAGVGIRWAGVCFADAVGVAVVPLTAGAAAVSGLTTDALAGAGVRLPVRSCTTGADESLAELTMRVGLGLADVPVAFADAGPCVRAVDAEELLDDVCPDASGAAVATAVPAPEAISKPAPTANPNVVIRPARFMEVTPGPRPYHRE